MNVKRLISLGGYFLFLVIAFLLGGVLQRTTSAQTPKYGSDLRDRIAIQEKLLYAYAYTYDSKDCVGWSNLFTTEAIFSWETKLTGRDAILQACTARQKDVVGNIKTHHNMTNIVFDELTPNEAKTRTYVVLTWQKPGDKTPSMQGVGMYRDVIVKQDGRWLFKERDLLMQ